MKSIDVLVSVAPFEPLSVIERSVSSIMGLEHPDMDMQIFYRVAGMPRTDERIRYLQDRQVNVIMRENPTGGKAGALNNAINNINTGSYYTSLFDVDSRPDSNFLVECIRALESSPAAALATGIRYVTNADVSRTTRLVSAEYQILTHAYRLFDWSGAFKPFNGIIGVIYSSAFRDMHIDEGKLCEDFDIMQRIYIRGNITVFTKRTGVGEQAPLTITELYKQRIRWISGGFEAIGNLTSIIGSNAKMRVKLTMLAVIVLPLFMPLFIPLLPAYVPQIWKQSDGLKDLVIKTTGVAMSALMLQLCALVAIYKIVMGKNIEWVAANRTEA